MMEETSFMYGSWVLSSCIRLSAVCMYIRGVAIASLRMAWRLQNERGELNDFNSDKIA